ncbi:MAG: CPBP family intramembrane metalloprotease [Planctomycetota bacterium]|nr:MAG: CPBP family intramembrane metalloprotease [Planctomycetota bacterium]
MRSLGPVTVFLVFFYAILMLVLTITFFVVWLRHRRQLRRYRRYGFGAGIVLVMSESVVSILLFKYGVELRGPVGLLIVTDIVAFFRVCAFAIVGIHYCALIGVASLPLLMRRFSTGKVDSDAVSESEKSNESEAKDVSGELEGSGIQPEGEEKGVPVVAMPAINIREMATSVLAVALGGTVFSVILFWITKPEISDMLQVWARRYQLEGLDFWQRNVIGAIAVLAFAFSEEIVFRLGIQNFLAKHFKWEVRNYWWAILLTTIIWSIGHVGIMNPGWVKMVQVFPVGLAFGWLFQRYGAESSIIAHGLFNVVLLIPGQYLISQ